MMILPILIFCGGKQPEKCLHQDTKQATIHASLQSVIQAWQLVFTKRINPLYAAFLLHLKVSRKRGVIKLHSLQSLMGRTFGTS